MPDDNEAVPSDSTQHPGSALPLGYEFCGFRIEKVLGQGGFGFTYLAHEKTLDRRAAIKELFPRQYVVRVDRVQVVPRHASDRPRFDQARLLFLEEARRLAKFHHENIVRVQRLLEDHNGTAYFAMDFIEGGNFQQWIRSHRSPSEAQLKRILLPLLDGLEYLHSHDVLHQDISPENIIINSHGQPILIDFGSAHEASASETRTRPEVTRAGYSAYEQYAVGAKGPYTDLYALAGVMVHAIMGKVPPSALDRRSNPAAFRPMAESYRNRYSPGLLRAIDRAFSIMPAERPRSVTDFRKILLEGGQATPISSGAMDRLRHPWTLALAALAVLAILLAVVFSGGKSSSPAPVPPAAPVIANVLPPADSPSQFPAVLPAPTAPASSSSAPPAALPAQATTYRSASGMDFVEIPSLSANGRRIFFCVHQTRRRDYQFYIHEIPPSFYVPNYGTPVAEVNKFDDYPVAHVDHFEADSFCRQMTGQEIQSGRLPSGAVFRLPTSDEWSKAAHEESGDAHPWGNDWPPHTSTGAPGANLADESLEKVESLHSIYGSIENYNDTYPGTAPVKSFPLTTKEGLYDMGSNVEEWCSAGDDANRSVAISRGASWIDSDGSDATTRRINRRNINAGGFDWIGFRVVLELPSPP